MPFSTYLANKLLDHTVGKTSYTMPTNYMGLSSTTPTTAGANVTEPSSGAYARVATSGTSWNAASAGAVTNSATLTFPTATADWVAGANLTYGVAFDASTSGNLLYFGALTTAKPVLNGDTVSIAPGGVSISLS